MAGRRRGRPSSRRALTEPGEEPEHAAASEDGLQPNIESKRDVLLDSLVRFYSDPASFHQFKAVVCNEAGISLRILDFLVTNFAKSRSLYLVHEGRPFNVFVEYRAQLKGYSKRYFDPFCRREHTQFRGIDTTLGQMNFFRWAIQTGVLEYAMVHEQEIEDVMMDAIRLRLESGKPSKASELPAHPSAQPPKPRTVDTKKFTKTAMRTTLKF